MVQSTEVHVHYVNNTKTFIG